MTAKLFISVLLLSIAISTAARFISTTLYFSHGKSVDVKIEDAANLDAMTYKDAMDYRTQHTIKVGYLETLRRRILSPNGMYAFLGLFVPIFLTALISANEAIKTGKQIPEIKDRDTSWIKRV